MPFPSVRAVLIDLSGTLHVGDTPIPGAINAVQRLRDAGKKVRFVTNTSTKSSSRLLKQMTDLGFAIQKQEMFTSVVATAKYLKSGGAGSGSINTTQSEQLRPFCIMEDTSELEDMGIPLTPPYNCVVVGLAPTRFHYDVLNEAFRILMKYPNLIALHRANYYLRDPADGDQLSLGPNAFITGLETAVGDCQAVVMGKPCAEFFHSALVPGISAEETCMIGDDVRQDVCGAIKKAGLGGAILVKTGKYRAGDEKCLSELGSRAVSCASIVEAVDLILAGS